MSQPGTRERPIGEPGARARSRDWSILALGALVLLGVAARVLTMLAIEPGIFTYNDSIEYASTSAGDPFGALFHPAGYPLFLDGVRALVSTVPFTMAVQHVLGIVTALLLFFAVRRLGYRWAGLVPAAVVLLVGDQLSLEQSLLSEVLFTVLFAGFLYAAIRTMGDRRPGLWAAVAGLLLAASVTVRTAGLVLVPLFVLWLAFCPPRTRATSVRRAAAGLAAALVVLLAYSAVSDKETGHFGVTKLSGWALYARVAPFADCGQFSPPAGTRQLCETTPSWTRPGPDYYFWNPDAPAQRTLGAPPAGNAKLATFARRAVLHQPVYYTKAVVADMWRYFVPHSGPWRRGDFGTGFSLLDVTRRAPLQEQQSERELSKIYGEPVRIHRAAGLAELQDYQDVARFHGPLLLACLLLGVAGAVVTAGAVRWALVLLTASSFLLMLVPAATMVYHARYAVPSNGPLAAAGAIGLIALVQKALAWRTRLPHGPGT
ncbi:MAG: hypothetical protein ACJ76V_04355 [Thermoleophilaceae bacterium]